MYGVLQSCDSSFLFRSAIHAVIIPHAMAPWFVSSLHQHVKCVLLTYMHDGNAAHSFLATLRSTEHLVLSANQLPSSHLVLAALRANQRHHELMSVVVGLQRCHTKQAQIIPALNVG